MTEQAASDDMSEKKLLEQFARTLRDLMATVGMNNAELGRRIDRTGGMVAKYLAGTDWPKPRLVFKIEKVFELTPGTLSRLLEFCPCDQGAPPTVRDVILTATEIDDQQRRMLLVAYESFRQTAGRHDAEMSAARPLSSP